MYSKFWNRISFFSFLTQKNQNEQQQKQEIKRKQQTSTYA